MTYSGYVTKLFTVPFLSWLLGMTVLIGSILLFVHFMQRNKQKPRQKPVILMLKSLPFAFGIPIALTVVLLASMQLKMGMPLITEKPEDALEAVGKITEMKEDDLSKVTHDAQGRAIRAQHVSLGELGLYCADVGEFGKGDLVQVKYLPKSGVVLSIGKPTDQPSTSPTQQPTAKLLINPAIGMMIFTMLFIATYLFNLVRARGKRRYVQDAQWGRDTVELRYRDVPLLMGIRCVIAVAMLLCVPGSYMLGIPMVLLAVTSPIHAGPRVPLAYNENGITITVITGRQFFYGWDDVVSVTQAYSPVFRLYPTPCIKVTYRTESGKEESMYYAIADHVGTKRFELYAERYIGQNTEE